MTETTEEVTGTDGELYTVTYQTTISRLEPVGGSTPEPPDPEPPQPTPEGYPDETNTGPAPGTVFKDQSGEIVVKAVNTVIKNVRLTGPITVQAKGCVVQDCEIDASGALWGVGIPDGTDVKDLKVIRCKIWGKGRAGHRTEDHVLSGVYGGAEVSHCNIWGCENGLTQGRANPWYHDNYIHDFANWPSEHDDHTDGVQTYGWAGTSGLRIVHNTILGMDTMGEFSASNARVASSCIALSQDQNDLTIEDNFMAGGTFTMYGNAQAGGAPASTRVINNKFSTMYRPKCGEYGCSSGFNKNGSGFEWSGNELVPAGSSVAPAATANAGLAPRKSRTKK